MSGVLIFHNILWAHYKGRVFSELWELCDEQSLPCFVVHFAATERQRNSLGAVDRDLHQYPYSLVSNGSFEELGLIKKVRAGIKALRTHDPDIVVLPGYWDPSFWIILLAAKLRGRKVILGCDSTELDRSRHKFKELLKRLFVRNCDAGFAYGLRARAYLRTLGMPDDKITIRCQATANDVIAVAHEEARPARGALIKDLNLGRHNFCYVGRLGAEKNVSTLLEAFKTLKDEPGSDSWGLLIVGDGPERASLMQICADARIQNVAFVGGVHWRDVPKYLAAADVVVLPSLSEPWGLVVNEAMVCGLPVIVSDRCGCVDDLVVSGVTGFTFEPNSIEALMQRMKYFVDTPAHTAQLGKQAKEFIQGFSPRAAATQMLTGVNALLNQSHDRTNKPELPSSRVSD
jgi:glycosyltransferase involved in cell wall biosynthesis